MRIVRVTVLFGLVIALLPAIRLAAQSAPGPQGPVTAADVTRLDSMADAIADRVTTLRKTDSTLAADVDKRLADLRDEITYLRVKLRREGSVSRTDYLDLRDRLDTLRIRATGERVTAQPTFEGVPAVYSVPVGTEFDVRLQTPLNSGTVKVEDRFEATTILDFTMSGQVVIPAGTLMRGFVSSVRPAGRISRQGSLTLSFDEIVFGSDHQRLRASVLQALDGKVSDDATRIGVGAAVGAILGGLIGGGKGALVGVLVGGGGTMASTEGADVVLPVGTILRIRLDQPVEVVRK